MRSSLLALLGCLAAAPASSQTLAVDFLPGPDSSFPHIVGTVGEQLLVSARTDEGRGLYAVRGEQATRLFTGYAWRGRASLDDTFYFFRYDDERSSISLWRTDGTVDETRLVAEIDGYPGYLTVSGDRLFYLVSNPGTGFESTRLWTSDGTSSGTREVPEARPAKNDGLRYVVTPSATGVFFSAEGGSTLWQSDGEGASRAATFGEGRPGASGGFFYGSALSVGETVFALVAEADPQGLYVVDADGERAVAPLYVASSNQSLVPFGDGVLFGEPSAGGGGPVTFYAATRDGAVPIGPQFDDGPLQNPATATPLPDGSVALAAERGGVAEVWRVAPGEEARLALRLPPGERALSGYGRFDVPTATRTNPPVLLAGDQLYVISERYLGTESEHDFHYSLWRADGMDGEALATNLTSEPTFATVGGVSYATLSTPETGAELFVLERSAVATEPATPSEGFALRLAGPNPVREQTAFAVSAPAGERVRVEAFDLLGRRVAVLHDGLAPADAVSFDARGLTPGLYIVRAEAAGARQTLRVVVSR